MNRKELFKWFPEAKAAFKSGGRWEHSPESAEVGDAIFTHCHDCTPSHWMQNTYCLGFEVEDKEVRAVVWDCDQDGNWDVTHTMPLKEVEKWYKETGREARESHLEYSRFVVETGTDPLGEFYVRNPMRGEERWKWHLRKDGNDVRVAWVEVLREGEWTPVMSDFPKEVLDYCRDGLTWRQCKRLAKKPARAMQAWEVTGRGEMEVTDVIHVSRPNPNYVEELKAAARRHLERGL